MSLKADIGMIIEKWKDDKDRLTHNNQLFNIYEGDLLTYILEDLRESLNENSYNQIKFRVAPINVLKRLIDKLSKIYSRSPNRTVQNGDGKDAGEKDKDLITWYREQLDFDVTMNQANEFFNLFKNCWIEPYLDQGAPKLRVIPSDRFFVISTDKINPLRVTHLVKIMGTMRDKKGNESTLFFAYTDEEFLAFNDKEEVQVDIMRLAAESDPNLVGINPYGCIPGVYVNRSKFDLIPKIDSDTLCMTKIIPVLLSDLNFAAMFQSFAIVYGINLDEQELKRAPNAFWRFKTDPATPDAKPEIGMIKPEADIDKVLNLIQTELSFWMNSRNIRPGTIGVMNYDNVSSGVAKIIDEMDTSEDRTKQVPFFVEGEKQFWKQIIEKLHPVWAKLKEFPKRETFSPGTKVVTNFSEQRPLTDRSALIKDEIVLIDARLESRHGALKTINPDWSEDQIQAKLKEIDDSGIEDAKTNPDNLVNDDAGGDPSAMSAAAQSGK